MVNEFIYNIEFATNNQDIISIYPSSFKNFYIANINDNGDEIAYGVNEDHLKANYFMIRIINDRSRDASEVIDRLYNKKDIVSILIHFTNGKTQAFDIPKKRVQNDGVLTNTYEDAFMYEDDLCIIISDKNIKYKRELFA